MLNKMPQLKNKKRKQNYKTILSSLIIIKMKGLKTIKIGLAACVVLVLGYVCLVALYFDQSSPWLQSQQSRSLNFTYTALMRYWEYHPIVLPPPDAIPVINATRVTSGIKFISFEPYAGFNNVRYQMETVFVLAHILNRTLVLPPRHHMTLQSEQSLLEDFWDIHDMRAAGVNVWTNEQFLDHIGIPQDHSTRDSFNDWQLFMADKGFCPPWDMLANVLAFPDKETVDTVSNNLAHGFPSISEFASGRSVIEMSPELYSHEHIHFKIRIPEFRLFGIFYTFTYFADVRWHAYYVALVRRHLHFTREITDVAGMIVQEIRDSSHGEDFVAMHIRRGDFNAQYPHTQIASTYIWQNTRSLVQKLKTIYISSDETDMEYFRDLEVHFNTTYRLDQFKNLLEVNQVRSIHHPMIEQMICYGARIFIGTALSTFSGFIHRMRAFAPSELSSGTYDRGFYQAQVPYSGDPLEDTKMTNASWIMSSGNVWRHGLWTREFVYGMYPNVSWS
jgi:hypothetical protein